ncbi:hypothetical protein ACFX1W_012637 [Malus domestica]
MVAYSGNMGEPSNIDGGAVVGEALAIVGGVRETMGEIGRIMFSGAESDEAMLGGPTGNVGKLGIRGVDMKPMLGGLSGNVGGIGGLERETMVVGLMALTRSLEKQRQNVMNLIGVLRGGHEGG